MTMKILVVFVLTIIIVQTKSSPDAVDDFNRISAGLSQNKYSELKVTEEKQVKKVEIKSQGSDQAAFSSQFLHEGHNLFFQPQIIIGPGVNAPFLSRNVDDKKDKKDADELHINIIIPTKNDTSDKSDVEPIELQDIPEAPTLAPLIMPKLPEVIIKEPIIIPIRTEPTPVKEIIIEHDVVVIPEPPAFIPLNPPTVPVEVILPKPVSHIPNCLVGTVTVGTVACPPPIVISPDIIGVDKVMVQDTLLIPEPSPILPLRVPKIPLGVLYNTPVKTVIPYSEGVISTTRYLPSVKVSSIPLRAFNHRNLIIPKMAEIVVEKMHRGNLRIIKQEEEFSAFCAHSIALERVIPNIAVRKEIVRVEPLPRILEVPVRSIF